MKKEPAMTHVQAIDTYYGGVRGLMTGTLPFTCKCGGKTYKEKNEDGTITEKPVMHLEQTFKHIRGFHGERIKKYKDVA